VPVTKRFPSCGFCHGSQYKLWLNTRRRYSSLLCEFLLEFDQVGKKIFQAVKKMWIFSSTVFKSSGRLHDVYRGESLTVRASMIGSAPQIHISLAHSMASLTSSFCDYLYLPIWKPSLHKILAMCSTCQEEVRVKIPINVKLYKYDW